MAVWLLAYLYPLWLAGSFYVTWLIAWVLLGHAPRPSLDDPASIGGVMNLVYPISGLLLVAMPLLVALGFTASFFCPIRLWQGRQWPQKVALVSIYVTLCAIVLFTLRADPGRVVEWWFD